MAESQDKKPKGNVQLIEVKKGFLIDVLKSKYNLSYGDDDITDFIKGPSHSTIKRFFQGKRIRADNAKIICDALDLNWQEVTVYDANDVTASENVAVEESSDIAKISDKKKVPHNLRNSGAFSFVGRESDMANLHALLQDQNDIRPVVISAIAGSGKTELALQYAKAHLEDYPCGVCWIDNGQKSISPADIIISFAITYLNISPPERLKTQAMRLEYCLFHWQQQKNTLLIFDDVSEYAAIEACIPQHKTSFRILITTRKVLGASFKQYSLGCLSEESAITLVANVTGNDAYLDSKYQDTRKLCEWLGGLPLAVELVARYIYRKSSTSLEHILKELKNNPSVTHI